MKKLFNPDQKFFNIFLSILLIIMFIVSGYQLFKTDQLAGLMYTEKNKNKELQEDIANARSEVNKYKGLSENLDKIINEANTRFLQQEKRMNRLYAENTQLKGMNEQMALEISAIQEKYLNTIDSMMVAEGLNKSLESTIVMLEDKIRMLNEQIGKASVLSVSNVKATPLKEKEHGKSQRTAMAKKVEVLKVCFDIEKNKLVDNSEIKIYLRVLKPDGNVIYTKENASNKIKQPLTGTKVNISHEENMVYSIEKMNYCLRWHTNDSMKPGVYIAELFTDKYFIGTATFTLK